MNSNLLPEKPNLLELLDSWLIQMRGQRKSRHTLEGYGVAVRNYVRWCAAQGLTDGLTKANVVSYMANHPGQASTARLHLTVLKLFARWMAEEEGFDADPILAVKLPRSDIKAVASLTDDEVRRIIRACGDQSLRDKRDRAALTVLAETGLRSAELLALDVTDIDVVGCTLHVQAGKGRKGRRVRFSAGCAALLDRYRRARRQAGMPTGAGPLWISERGNRLSYTGLRNTLQARARDAGVTGFHPHRLRHTSAVRWLAAGGNEVGLMAQHGWSSRAMIDHYTKSASERLASQEFDRLNLGLGDI